MDACGTVVGIGFLIFLGYGVIEVVGERRKAKADRELLENNPQAWVAKEQVEIERQRLGAQIQHAAEESKRQNAGLVAGIIRSFFG